MERKSSDLRNNTFRRARNSKNMENNEKSVEVIHLELKGIEQTFD
jgi:hypothetical protein